MSKHRPSNETCRSLYETERNILICTIFILIGMVLSSILYAFFESSFSNTAENIKNENINNTKIDLIEGLTPKYETKIQEERHRGWTE
jgi:hypothetical protein